MSAEETERYLKDLGVLLKEKALETKESRDRLRPQGGADYDFEQGRLMGYLEVLSLMIQQAEAFGIPAKTIGLEDFNPELELL